MHMPNRLRPIAASLRQLAINQGKIALGFVIGGIATIAISAAVADINNGSSTLGNTSSILLSQETSKIADNLKQDAEDCAKGTTEGTIGHSIQQAMLIHETFAAAPVNVESLFDANGDCFSGVSQIFDLSFAIPSLSSIISAASSAVLQYAQKKVCTAVNQVSSLVTTPINQAITTVNGMTSFGDLNGLTNGLVQQGMSQIDPNIGAQYYTGTTGGTYTVNTNPFNATQTSFDTSTGGTTGGTTGGSTGGTTGGASSATFDQITQINQQLGSYQTQLISANQTVSQSQQQLASCQSQGLVCTSYEQQLTSAQLTVSRINSSISSLQTTLQALGSASTSVSVAPKAVSAPSASTSSQSGFIQSIGSLFN